MRSRGQRAIEGQLGHADPPPRARPQLGGRTIEPAESIVRLVPDDAPLEGLIAIGLQHRPELAQAQETVKATIIRLKQAKLRPLVPSVAASYEGGGFGGGQGAFFGNFGTAATLRGASSGTSGTWASPTSPSAAGGKPRTGRRTSTWYGSRPRSLPTWSLPMKPAHAAAAQIAEASRTVIEAVDSLNLNFTNIRQGSHLVGATRPIEVLQPIQALALAGIDYLESVLYYNRSQFRLFRALGNTPSLDSASCPPGAGAGPPTATGGTAPRPPAP